MLTYADLQEKIRRSRKGSPKLANNTWAEYAPNGEDIYVILHHTAVVTAHPDGTFTLDSGGWQTMTTKNRINDFSPAQVYQRDFQWYIGDGIPFKDIMKVDITGQPITPEPPVSSEAIA